MDAQKCKHISALSETFESTLGCKMDILLKYQGSV